MLDAKFHYIDVIMDTMGSQITSFTIVYSTIYSGADKENIKTPHHWPLCGKFTGDRCIPRTNGQWRGNVSIWWFNYFGTLNEIPLFDSLHWARVSNLSRLRICNRRLPEYYVEIIKHSRKIHIEELLINWSSLHWFHNMTTLQIFWPVV